MRPHLIHPRAVTLHKRAVEARDEYGDPENGATAETPVTLRGQVAYSKYDSMTPEGGGNDPRGDGHVIFYGDEWDAAGGRVGDELELSPSQSRLVILEVQPCGHYYGAAWLRKVVFSRKAATIRR